MRLHGDPERSRKLHVAARTNNTVACGLVAPDRWFFKMNPKP